ncbi:MAG: Hsp20/alpha crystallin family protein [Hyphomicrobiales bacterium]
MAFNDLIPWRTSRSPAHREQEPFNSLQREMSREMNRLFDDFWGGLAPRLSSPTGGKLLSPSVDLHETDQAYRATVELPGLNEEDAEINFRDNSLIVSGEKKAEHEEKEDGRHYMERSYGRFQRVIAFAAEVDADKVQAKFEKGVLTIDLPKNAKAQEKTRRIQINSDKRQSRH